MTEVKGIGRGRAQVLDDLRNRKRYRDPKEEAEDRNRWKHSLSVEQKEEIHIFYKSVDLLVSSILNKSNNMHVYVRN